MGVFHSRLDLAMSALNEKYSLPFLVHYQVKRNSVQTWKNLTDFNELLIDILGNILVLQRKQTKSQLNLEENWSD